MPQFQLTIIGTDQEDLERGVLEAAAWFRTTSPVALATGDAPSPAGPAAAEEETPAPRPRGRPRKAVQPVHPAAHPEAAGGVPGDDAGGSGEVHAAADAAAEAEETPAEEVAEAGGDAGDDLGGAGAEGAGSLDAQDPSAGPGELGADHPDPKVAEVTIEDIKAAAAAAISKKGFQDVKKVFDQHDVQKPGNTPPDKRAAVLASLKELAA